MQYMPRRPDLSRLVRSCAARLSCALVVCVAVGSAHAAEYPDRAIRVLVGFPPGGAADTTARMIGPPLSRALAKPVLIENRPGATGNIASAVVAKSPPDGYTLLLGTIATLSVNPSTYRSLPFDPLVDFAPITLATSSTNVLVVHPSLPVKSVRDLIALAKARPIELAVGASGTGTAGHLASALFDLMARTRMMPVIYKGGAATVIALLSGEVQLAFPTIDAALTHIHARKVRALAVTGRDRSQLFPELPTISESALPGYEAYNWYGIVIPAKTAASIVDRLNSEIVKILRTSEVSNLLLRQGLEPAPTTPAAFGAYIRSETEKWAKVVKAAGIEPE